MAAKNVDEWIKKIFSFYSLSLVNWWGASLILYRMYCYQKTFFVYFWSHFINQAIFTNQCTKKNHTYYVMYICIFLFPPDGGGTIHTQIDDTKRRFTYEYFFFFASTVTSKQKGSEYFFLHEVSNTCVGMQRRWSCTGIPSPVPNGNRWTGIDR